MTDSRKHLIKSLTHRSLKNQDVKRILNICIETVRRSDGGINSRHIYITPKSLNDRVSKYTGWIFVYNNRGKIYHVVKYKDGMTVKSKTNHILQREDKPAQETRRDRAVDNKHKSITGE